MYERNHYFNPWRHSTEFLPHLHHFVSPHENSKHNPVYIVCTALKLKSVVLPTFCNMDNQFGFQCAAHGIIECDSSEYSWSPTFNKVYNIIIAANSTTPKYSEGKPTQTGYNSYIHAWSITNFNTMHRSVMLYRWG